MLGSKEFICKARRVRKVFGGGMRQAGIIAAGGLFALKNNIERLKEDHQKAKIIEAELNQCSWVESVLPVETNIVVAILKDQSKRDEFIKKLKNKKCLIMAFGPGMLRMVTHLDISLGDVEEFCSNLKSLN